LENKELDGFSQAQRYLFYPYLFRNGKWEASQLIYFESIDASLDALARRLNLSFPSFSSANIHHKQNRKSRDYRNYYTDEQAEFVGAHFKELLRYAPYEFDKVNMRPDNGSDK
jgi:hypothetical protein